MKKLIKSVTVRDSQSSWNNQKVDILLQDSTILEIGPKLQDSQAQLIEGNQLSIFPQIADGRTHFFLPGGEQKEDWNELIQSAKKGGIKAVRLFPCGSQPAQSPEAIQFIQNKGKENGLEFTPVAALTLLNKGENFTDLYDLVRAGATYFSHAAGSIDNIDIMAKCLQYLSPMPVTIIVQPDTHLLSLYGQIHEGSQSTYLGLKGIPAISEELAIKRDLDLLRYTLKNSFNQVNKKFNLHFTCISTEASVNLIKEAKKEGLPITADVSINNLCFTDDSLSDFDENKKVFPPLRSQNDKKALWKGLKEKTIDYVVSDHLPVEVEHKKVEFSYAEFGSVGLETLFLAFLQEAEKNKLENPADYFWNSSTISIEKGNQISALITENIPWTLTEDHLKNKAKNSIFIGTTFTSTIKLTI